MMRTMVFAALLGLAAPANAQTIKPDSLHFGDDVQVGSVSPPQTLILTAHSKDLNVSSISANSDYFSVTPQSCNLKAVGDSCAVAVSFAPKRKGAVKGAITIVSNGEVSSQTVLVDGNVTCDITGCAAFNESWGMAAIVVLYWLAFLAVRWNLVARPTRELLRAQIAAVRNRVEVIKALATSPNQALFDAVGQLLTTGEGLVNDDRWRLAGNFLFWSRGYEIAAWNCVHEAEERMTAILSTEGLRAGLERAEANLRQINNPTATALADDIKTAVASDASAMDQRWRALLSEALGIIYDRTDTEFATLVSWHNKTVWLLACALLLILALSIAQGNAILFLMGATGGLLSRLTRSLYRDDVPTDYGASWTTLFLSPAVGALMGWAGILLIILGEHIQVLGPMLKLNWCDPTTAITLALAFILGFSERLFDGILKQLEDKIQAKAASDPGSSPARPSAPQSSTLAITTDAKLPVGNKDQDYDQTLGATGGSEKYTWSGGESLPADLKLDASGHITGKPAAAGTTIVKLQVSDAKGAKASRDFVLEIKP